MSCRHVPGRGRRGPLGQGDAHQLHGRCLHAQNCTARHGGTQQGPHHRHQLLWWLYGCASHAVGSHATPDLLVHTCSFIEHAGTLCRNLAAINLPGSSAVLRAVPHQCGKDHCCRSQCMQMSNSGTDSRSVCVQERLASLLTAGQNLLCAASWTPSGLRWGCCLALSIPDRCAETIVPIGRPQNVIRCWLPHQPLPECRTSLRPPSKQAFSFPTSTICFGTFQRV